MSQPNFKEKDHFLNRELTHLDFHLRVLEQATSERHPLLERLKFLLIFDNNIDEFFEIRVAGLKRIIAVNKLSRGCDGLSAKEKLEKISEKCQQAIIYQYDILNDHILPALREEGIRFTRRSEWSPEQLEWVKHYFRQQVLPVMSPIGLDPAHPFPQLANKSLNFIVALDGVDAFGRTNSLAIVPAPRSLPRLIRFPDELCTSGHNFVFLSAMIHAHAQELFPGMDVKGCFQFRLTRNADLYLEEELVDDLALAIKSELSSRQYGDAVRLEVADNCPLALSDFLLQQFGLSQDELYRVNGMVNLSRMMQITELDLPHLRYPPYVPSVPKIIQRSKTIFDAISQQDILLLHPYQSYSPVIDLLRQSANDPNVLAIKQTLYRTEKNSSVLRLLESAARAGKEVTCVVEVRARFDEESNLEIANQLQAAGATVCYGVVGFKTHAKMLLVVRRENNKLVRYFHLGTGNYHRGNARIYTDYSLLSSDQVTGIDVNKIFQQLTGMGSEAKLKRIFHAPFTLHNKLISLIDRETHFATQGKNAQIMIKVNSITEPNIIEALYKASGAGVKIELVIRGICCLKPGIPGVSENIRVRSIVGRFLEHTRVYYFHNDNDPKVFCSSADLMERNLHHRVETCFPILDPDLIKRIKTEGLGVFLSDNVDAWLLNEEGIYHQIPTSDQAKCAQQILTEKYSGKI